MQNWLNDRNELTYVFDRPGERFRMPEANAYPERLEPVGAPPEEMGVLGQYYTAGSVWFEGGFQVSIPYRGQQERETILREIAPYFRKLLHGVEPQVESDGNRQGGTGRSRIDASDIRPEASESFAQARTAALPLMEDLYRHRDIDRLLRPPTYPLLQYPINREALAPYPAEALEELRPLREFLLATYFDTEERPEYILSPAGWVFDESLRDSPILRFFASFMPHLALMVDSGSGEVCILMMSMSPIREALKLGEPKEVPSRLHKRRVYFDIGQELVMVVDPAAQPGKDELSAWEQVRACEVYLRREGVAFVDFDHEENGERLEGIGFGFDSVWSERMTIALREYL